MKVAKKFSLIFLSSSDTVYPKEIGSAAEQKLCWLMDIVLVTKLCILPAFIKIGVCSKGLNLILNCLNRRIALRPISALKTEFQVSRDLFDQ